jgi:transcriptional regulator with XRE-family HTH domain
MTLDEYRREFGWSISELARRANIDYTTANKALKGESVSGRTAVALAQAISEGLGRNVRYQDIKGLNVNL